MADADKKSRVVFVNVDICMGTQIMKMQVTLLGTTPVELFNINTNTHT